MERPHTSDGNEPYPQIDSGFGELSGPLYKDARDSAEGVTIDGGADLIQLIYDHHEIDDIGDFGLGGSMPALPQLPPQLEFYKEQTAREKRYCGRLPSSHPLN